MKIIMAREGRGYPIYTKKIMEVSDSYVKDGEVLKSRHIKPELLDVEGQKLFFNNIAIEENGVVEIYCEESRRDNYIKEIKWLKNMYGEEFEHDKFFIYSR